MSFGSTRVQRNRRLTTDAGLLLAPLLLAAAGSAVLVRRGVVAPHLAAGLLLIPPLGLKLVSAGSRFALYHLGDPAYVAAGVPAPGLRPIAPPLVLSICALMVSGVVLWLDPAPASVSIWLPVHRLSFLLFGACAGIHVVVHLLRAPTLGLEGRIGGGRRRLAEVALSLGLGLFLAAVALAWRP